MVLFLTVDDKGGLAFNRRRQSRDSAVVTDILSVVGGEKLYMRPYSAPLFGGAGNIVETENPQADGKDGFCFAEAMSVSTENVDVLYLYHWGKVYPSDIKLPVFSGMTKIEVRDFAGSSHEKITLEVYRK